MTCTPQHFDYSIPPSPIIPPVPCVSRASSSSSLNSLYELDGEKAVQGSYRYTRYEYPNENPRTPPQAYLSMSKTPGQLLFTDDDLEKAFQDRHDMLSSPQSGNRLAHDVSDPQSPWKRSIRLRYSELNIRDSNSIALQEASNLLSQDMSSYVNSEDESVERGSPVSKISPAAASASLNARLQEALASLEKTRIGEDNNSTA